MAYIPVGIIAARDEDGNFLPPRPIYIEAEEQKIELSDIEQKHPVDDSAFAKCMARRFKEYQRAAQKEQRKAEKEKGARKGA